MSLYDKNATMKKNVRSSNLSQDPQLYAFLANSTNQGKRTKQNSFLEAIIKRSNLSTAYGCYLLANARLETYPIVHAR